MPVGACAGRVPPTHPTQGRRKPEKFTKTSILGGLLFTHCQETRPGRWRPQSMLVVCQNQIKICSTPISKATLQDLATTPRPGAGVGRQAFPLVPRFRSPARQAAICQCSVTERRVLLHATPLAGAQSCVGCRCPSRGASEHCCSSLCGERRTRI